MRYKKSTLPNGASLGFIHIPHIEFATISVFIKSGYKYDPPEKIGIAHMTEHMLFNGTKKFPSPKSFAWVIEQFGGYFHGFTWIEHQQYSICLPKKHLAHGVGLLLDMIVNPSLFKEEFEKEKGVILEEISRNTITPENQVFESLWLPLFFQGTHLNRQYSGQKQDIEKLHINDCKLFLKENFLPESTVFLVAGNFNEEKIFEIFENENRMYRNKKDDRKIIIKPLQEKKISILKNNNARSSIAIGIKGVGFQDEEKHVLELTKDLLGGYFGARLPQRLKEEGGLIYNWDMWQENVLDTGYMVFRTSTYSENVNKLISIVLDEFEKLTKELVKKEELDVVKGHICGSLFCNTQTAFDIIQWYGMQELLGNKILSLTEQSLLYEKISAEEILITAQKYLKRDNMYIAAVGDVVLKDSSASSE